MHLIEALLLSVSARLIWHSTTFDTSVEGNTDSWRVLSLTFNLSAQPVKIVRYGYRANRSGINFVSCGGISWGCCRC